MVDAIVTLTRFVCGVSVMAALGVFMLVLMWPLEVIVGFPTLLVAAICMDREDIKNSWLGKWPLNSPNQLSEMIGKIWHWIFDD